MINYTEVDIVDLIMMVRSDDDGAFSEIVNRYTPMLSKVATGFVCSSVSFDEAFVEATLALHKAAMSYDLAMTEVTFGLYAQICAHRRLCDFAVKAAKGSIFIGTEIDLVDTELDIESTLVGRERMREYLNSARSILSEYEYQVFLGYINGETTAELSIRLGKSRKSIENAKARMLKNLRAQSDIFSDI